MQATIGLEVLLAAALPVADTADADKGVVDPVGFGRTVAVSTAAARIVVVDTVVARTVVARTVVVRIVVVGIAAVNTVAAAESIVVDESASCIDRRQVSVCWTWKRKSADW